MNAVLSGERLLIETDYRRLLALGAGRLPPELAEALEFHDLVAHAEAPADLVTLGAEVDLRDPQGGRRYRLKLCEPGLSDPALGFVSVLSPVGAALLGLRAGMVARWALPMGGEREALIESVSFQPAFQPAAQAA